MFRAFPIAKTKPPERIPDSAMKDRVGSEGSYRSCISKSNDPFECLSLRDSSLNTRENFIAIPANNPCFFPNLEPVDKFLANIYRYQVPHSTFCGRFVKARYPQWST